MPTTMSGRMSVAMLVTYSLASFATQTSSFANTPASWRGRRPTRPRSHSSSLVAPPVAVAARRGGRGTSRLTVRAYDTSASTQLPIATYQLAGLYNCVMSESDGTVTPSRVFLRPGGTFDFLSPTSDGDGDSGGEESEARDGAATPDAALPVGYRGNVAGHGYWAILTTGEIELAVPQKGGGPAMTYIGRVDGDKIGAAEDDGSEIVRISGRVSCGHATGATTTTTAATTATTTNQRHHY